MAIWETTSRYTTWASNGELLRRTNVIEKISDEKSGEQTFEVNEAVKLTFSGIVSYNHGVRNRRFGTGNGRNFHI